MTKLESIDYTLEYPYTRSTGPVWGPFLTGLRDGKILGARIGNKIYCPPLEFDPETAAAAEPDLVEVGPGGTVSGWTWVTKPTTKHPFDHPFAFALIVLDGADTAMAHAIDAKTEAAMRTGMRVSAQFRDERVGAVTDVYFVPEADAVDQEIAAGDEPVAITIHSIGVDISEPLSPHRVRFAEGLRNGKIIGQKSPTSGLVYVPGRGYDNMERVRMDESCDVEVADVGTVVAYTTISPIQYHGQTETEPYIRCSILLDGADQPLGGIDIRDMTPEEFRTGMRLKCVWRPPEERDYSDLDNRGGGLTEGVYERWEPTGEPDVDFESIKEHTW
ncbi:MAG: OB-fold domain-containing protein [Acidobacteria bacterium]|nr:OB-fold domain-containing protein [Acidobacteriota bacterium]